MIERTPDEIKKGLSCCAGDAPCKECPYYNGNNCGCGNEKNRDALAYIRQLERERDAAVRDLDNKSHGCDKCKHDRASIKKTCDLPIEKRKPSYMCWEWRGVQEEEQNV